MVDNDGNLRIKKYDRVSKMGIHQTGRARKEYLSKSDFGLILFFAFFIYIAVTVTMKRLSAATSSFILLKT